MKTTSVNTKVSDSKTSKLKRLIEKKKKDAIKEKLRESSTTCSTTEDNKCNNTKTNEVAGTKRSRPVPSLTHNKHISLPSLSESQNYSSNWKQLLSSLPNNPSSKLSLHNAPPMPLISKNTQLYQKKFQNEKKSKQIWFDGIDETLLETESNKTKSLILGQNSDNEPKTTVINFLKNRKSTVDNRVSEYIALDCEMVGIGDDGKDNMLARVSLCNQYGSCVYDKFVKPREPITDYRTVVSGITPDKLKIGTEFKIVQKEVSDLINGKILVGHAVSNDLKVLFLDHPRKRIRDTSRYKPFRKIFEGRTPSLKNLTKKFFGIEIQDGSHNSVIDAQATMKIFMKHRKEWESQYSKPRNKIWKK